ncbi:MAG: efflux RND transporter periplasmic adaptor subunit [Mediterranea sp.]|jgi:membrane fusion protein (multidrug efflux system)|nr:efflux RND transporter periplasmic adaptor subunit [Mediterranea sp.]
MNQKKTIRWGISIIVGVALIGWGIYSQLPKENKELTVADKVAASRGAGGGRRALNVIGKIVKPQLLKDEQNFVGTLIPDEEVDLSFESSGKIISINFEEGRRVAKGELLAKVNDAPLQAQLKRLTVQLQLAEDRVYRQSALLEKDAVSKEAYEQAQTELATLNADIDLVKANIAQTELRAPFDGIIGLRKVSVGAYAVPSTVVAKLTRITPLKIEFSIPERYGSVVPMGSNLDFKVEGHLDPFHGKVYARETGMNLDTRSLTLRALYSNADGKLMPGRFAEITLKRAEIKDALAIPTEAIVPEMGKDKVFLYRNGQAQPTEITAGIRTDAEVEVLQGLQEGDTIIVSGTLQLRTGLPVTLDAVN